MDALNEALQHFAGKEYDRLVELGKEAYAAILPVARAIDAEHDGEVMMTSIVLSAVGADGVLSEPENRFLKDVLGLTDEGVDKLITLYNDQCEDLTDMLFDNSEPDFQQALFTFVLCILAVDKTITPKETAFLKKLVT